jgi:hypothetical protein
MKPQKILIVLCVLIGFSTTAYSAVCIARVNEIGQTRLFGAAVLFPVVVISFLYLAELLSM